MTILYKYIILAFILSSCAQGNNSKFEKESMLLHSSINEILLNNSQYDSVIVQLETKPIYKTFYNQRRNYPPPPGTLIFSKERLSLLVEKDFLNSDDVEFMLSRIDSTRIFYIDSLKICKSTIKKQQLDSLFSKFGVNAYKELTSCFGAESFIKFGTPMFNLDQTKLLITTEYYSDTEMYQQLIYILEYQESKWKIKYELGLP